MDPKLSFLAFFILILFLQTSSAEKIACNITQNAQGLLKDNCPSLYSCINQQCVHKDIFPLTTKETIGSMLIMLVGGMHSSGGLGGGSKMAPFLYTLFNYDTAKAISIVYILIFGGSLGNFLNVFKSRDPKTKRPLIIYDLALLVMPSMVIGTDFGVMLNQIAPPIVTLIGVTLLQWNSFKKIYAKTKVAYVEESKIQSPPTNDNSFDNEAQPQEIDTNTDLDEGKSANSDEIALIEKEDHTLFPKKKLALCMGLLIFTSIMAYLRGTEKFDSILGIEHCSAEYWGFFVVGLIGVFFFFLNNRRFVSRRLAIKRELEPTREQNYQINNEKDVRKLCTQGFVAGFLAGLLGIGGGLILSPILLKLGVEAQSQAATVGFFVVQTAFTSLFQSFLYGNVSTNELIYFFGISVLGSYMFSAIMSWIVKKTNRPSILLFLQLIIIIVSIIAMPMFGIWKAYENPKEMFAVSPLC